MKIIQEREAFEEGFERLQRIYKEWHRNPSALVRDSLKKYLIECYDHLLKLDRIDIDAGKFEDEIMSDRHIERVQKQTSIPKIEIVMEEEVQKEEVKAEEPIAAVEEEVVLEESIELKEEVPVEAVIEDSVEEEIAEINAEVEEIEAQEEEIVIESSEEVKEVLDPNEVYLSGSEELEIEEYFKNNFPEESKVDETETSITEAIDETEIVAEQEETIAEKTTENEIVAEENEEEIVEEIVQGTTEEVESETEIVEEEKSRWSSFFSKDEPKPFESSNAGESQQLTLADKLATTSKKEEGVHYEMKEQAITDLNSAIPIAKKFEFIRELFGDDSTNYKTAVASLDEAADVQIALDISENLAETYAWSSNEKLADEFNTFVKRRFS